MVEAVFPFPQTPSLYVQNEGEDVSTKAALSLTKARDKVVVRLTGGCGLMSAEDADGLFKLFTQAFGTVFGGAFLFGGTQMRKRGEPTIIVPGITEIGPLIKRQCPQSIVLGVVPKTQDLHITPIGMVVSNEPGSEYVTIVHPEQDVCLVIQKSADTAVMWDAEYQMCMTIVEQLISFAGFSAVLLAYNGGGTTEKEVRAWARKNWPVILVAGSGRVSDKLSADEGFLEENPSVHVVERNSVALLHALASLGALPESEARRVVQFSAEKRA